MRKILSIPFKITAYILGALFGASLLLLSVVRYGVVDGLKKIEVISKKLEDTFD